MPPSGRSNPPAALVDRLRCPRCGRPVAAADAGGTIVCPEGHRYGSSNGYLDVSVGSGRRHHRTDICQLRLRVEHLRRGPRRGRRFADVYFHDLDLEAWPAR